ncbi:MAG: flagellar basal body P-ring protein FlgI [Alphaproteobacteria bacterium]|jgi:flagellar P-ring protein precursor FlgI|uniref:flagellar basal body P-ring protein FlgI n=1 Tax=Pacificispira sp. TaxID=2888761 RepID=UPI001B181367|nr:flagellar basal body P-ring protein FlgI [Alphaproteobacteria bacterium]MBO6861825.1 flagellar basal body P-ring protein FlgI [Alphaproteobacteria bacterium]MEC9266589.1 flagellar basal body P-ring protein FlgI [Pseudomonadota bacterium]
MTKDFRIRSQGYGDIRTPGFRVLLRWLAALTLIALCWALVPAVASAQSRIKDIVDFEGVRDNMLVGYGLVVGLNGTGDSLDSAVFTRESLVGMLQRMGVNASDANLDTDNVAAVMVTATLPPFSRQGSRVDVVVSAMGDADSLLGGTLLVTPLLGADGEIYAVSQGTVAVGGFSAQGAAETVVKGVPTSGRIANGAIIEREIPFELAQLRTVKLSLRNPDFTTARRISRAIDAFVGEPTAKTLDPATVQLVIPPSYDGELVELLTDVEQLRVEPDQIARVVIDEQSGVIVMGENVGISTVAVAQGNLTVRITETQQVSQPSPFSNTGTTEVVDRTNIEIDEDADRRLGIVGGTVELQDLVNGLNALGVGPRDMITILQAIKAAGALQAEIEVL